MFEMIFIPNINTIIIEKYKTEIELNVLNQILSKENIDYDFWDEKDLEYISKVDLSTPIEDDEDYSQW